MKRRRRQHRRMSLWTISISSIALYEHASMGHPNGAYHLFVGVFQSRRLVATADVKKLTKTLTGTRIGLAASSAFVPLGHKRTTKEGAI